ncbi:hypothetical protein [Myxococcus sp. CA039A]|uniref:hypothetical protein n=1 Tax=Myxococcus sp. CA039A TaxID=2741737 RepID=UPI00157A548F|nr:hypothetical protein [Myxococcus sp. CA039A]NTX54826.1 hypothetical protein [Myxococcus sp. CA039A]
MRRPSLLTVARAWLLVSSAAFVWLGVELYAYHPDHASVCWLLAAVGLLVLAAVGWLSTSPVEELSLPPVRRASGHARLNTTPTRSP